MIVAPLVILRILRNGPVFTRPDHSYLFYSITPAERFLPHDEPLSVRSTLRMRCKGVNFLLVSPGSPSTRPLAEPEVPAIITAFGDSFQPQAFPVPTSRTDRVVFSVSVR